MDFPLIICKFPGSFDQSFPDVYEGACFGYRQLFFIDKEIEINPHMPGLLNCLTRKTDRLGIPLQCPSMQIRIELQDKCKVIAIEKSTIKGIGAARSLCPVCAGFGKAGESSKEKNQDRLQTEKNRGILSGVEF
ncbi:MAG: hypothetical protein JXR67_06685 [Bacteroidales bacterium]|nr:hypothetical protein [Bacteroidales bacterium]